MKKLNNKGMTIIEILVCFIIVSIISASIYAIVSNYNNKKNVESYKQEIYKYKNLLTKEIYDDIIFKGVVKVTNHGGDRVFAGSPRDIIKNCTTPYYHPNSQTCVSYLSYPIESQHGGVRLVLLDFTFRDNTQKTLQIATLKNNPIPNSSGKPTYDEDYNDSYYVSYGGIEYPVPNLGETTVPPSGPTLKNLSLEIKECELTESNVFHLDVRFHHPDLEDKYGIQIIAPINMDYYDRK